MVAKYIAYMHITAELKVYIYYSYMCTNVESLSVDYRSTALECTYTI